MFAPAWHTHQQVAFGEVRTKKAGTGVLDALGGTPPKLPTLFLVCNGDLSLREAYQVCASWQLSLCVRTCVWQSSHSAMGGVNDVC